MLFRSRTDSFINIKSKKESRGLGGGCEGSYTHEWGLQSVNETTVDDDSISLVLTECAGCATVCMVERREKGK